MCLSQVLELNSTQQNGVPYLVLKFPTILWKLAWNYELVILAYSCGQSVNFEPSYLHILAVQLMNVTRIFYLFIYFFINSL